MLIRYEKKHKEMESKKIFVIAGVAAMVAGLAGCGGTKKMLIKQQKLMWDILIM